MRNALFIQFKKRTKMSEKTLDLMFEMNEIKKLECEKKSPSHSSELEEYIEEKKKQNVLETIGDYFNLDALKKIYSILPYFLKRLGKASSYMSPYYRSIPF
jgi:hypothetical protein